ncbi:MAG: DUF6819 domain-containing protein, partial [Planctomycetota bacterium]
ELAEIGRELLSNEEGLDGLEVLGENMEKSNRKVVILKPYEGYHAYRDMLYYYAVKNLMEYINANNESLSGMCGALKSECQREWTNLGGQLLPSKDFDKLRDDVGKGVLATWDDIHGRYDALWQDYPLEKQRHAYMTLCTLLGTDELTKEQWLSALDKSVTIQEFIRDEVYNSRKKDFDNPFRQATYRNIEEMTAAIGTIEDNSFVKQVRQETDVFRQAVEEVKNKS